MADPRDPDPTLDALGTEYVSLTPVNDDGTLERAHRYRDDDTDVARCGWEPTGLLTTLPGMLAAYIAVPCLDCFSGAPPPGHSRWPKTCSWCGQPQGPEPLGSGCGAEEHGPDRPQVEPGLAWQVPA